MSTKTSNAKDIDFKMISELSYLDLDNSNYNYKTKTLYDAFYDEKGKVRQEILTNAKKDSELDKFVKNLQLFPDNYKDSLKTYKLVDTYKDTDTGYYGIAVQDSKGEVIVGSRGTEFASVNDLLSDGSMAFGGLSHQFTSAQEFVNKIKENSAQGQYTVQLNSLSFTGHSLGGAISTYLMVNNYSDGIVAKTVTFEEFGIKKNLLNNKETYLPTFMNASGTSGKNVINPTGLEIAEKLATIPEADLNSIKTAFINSHDLIAIFSDHIGEVKLINGSQDIPKTNIELLKEVFLAHPINSYNLFKFKDGQLLPGEINQEYAKAYMNEIIKDSELSDEAKSLIVLPKTFTVENIFSTISDIKYQCKFYDGMSSQEIAKFKTLRAQFNSIAANPGKYGLPDPIAIDLDGDGIETVSKEKSTAYFDLDKNGYAEKTGWISGDDALLVRDINSDGVINNSSELFGDKTVLKNGTTSSNGFAALSDLDSNNDGKLSSEDDAFNELKIWQDKNQDGISQSDELMSLEEAGIKNISLDTVNINSGDGNGNIIEKVSKVEFEDGKVTQAGQFCLTTNYANFTNINLCF